MFVEFIPDKCKDFFSNVKERITNPKNTEGGIKKIPPSSAKLCSFC